MRLIEKIYKALDNQGDDFDVHLAIEDVAKETGISEEELLEIYDTEW